MTIARRTFLVNAIGTALTSNLGGCAGLVHPLQPVCANDKTPLGHPNSLTIDTHAHVFNGSDLPVNEFLRYVKNIPLIGPILDELSWTVVPTGAQEMAELARLAPYFAACDDAAIAEAAARHSQQQYQEGLQQLRRAVAKALVRKRMAHDDVAEAARVINNLPHTYDEHKAARRLRSSRTARTRSKLTESVQGVIDFVLLMFQYRYVIFRDYLEEYSADSPHPINLVVAHIVDYDWPLAKGAPTPTPIPDQIDVMSRICALTAGRIHCYAPFDPIKQVAADSGKYSDYSPLAVVQDAILNKGCIGVKLYPVMGFRPFGNKELPVSHWHKPWFKQDLLTDDFGQRLDRALAALYEWCIDNDVPLMAHTSPSNGPHIKSGTIVCPTDSEEFACMSDPRWWKLTLEYFPRLRISFGHFGGYDEAATDSTRVRSFADLMNVAGSGQVAFADTAFYPEVITTPEALRERLRVLYKETAKKGDAALAQRLMYASDWHMLVARGRRTRDYLNDFVRLYNVLNKDTSLGAQGRLSERYFGLNAVNYLGLRQGDANRKRVEAFYASANVSHAPLLARIDQIAMQFART